MKIVREGALSMACALERANGKNKYSDMLRALVKENLRLKSAMHNIVKNQEVLIQIEKQLLDDIQELKTQRKEENVNMES